VNIKRISYSRNSTMVRLEKKLSNLIEDWNRCQVPVSVLLVQAKACSIYEDLLKGDDLVKPCSTSTGWFSRFMKRYNFYNIKITGEAASADTMAVIHSIG
jgi:hypothetical protein